MSDADPGTLRDDHDSPWKEALSEAFPEFLALLFPDIHADVDWPQGYEFLDTELQKIAPDAGTGRRHADKLVRINAYNGVEIWVVIHVEVQGKPRSDFAERMFVYHPRLRELYREVLNLAVLTDTVSTYRPDTYRYARGRLELSFRFPVAKLLDWAAPERWQALEASDNLFALVVMAQIRAKASRNVDERKAWKIRLIRLLFEKNFERAKITSVFRMIDWMIRLPKGAEQMFWREVREMESKHMPYVTSLERISREEGFEEGIEKGLEQGLERGRQEGKHQGRQQGEAAMLLRLVELKFGVEAAQHHRDRIERTDADTLLIWSGRILTADRVDAIFQE